MGSGKTAEVSAAIDLLVALLANAQQISALIQQATAAGATVLTPEQWAIIVESDDSAEASLAKAIAAAKAAGR